MAYDWSGLLYPERASMQSKPDAAHAVAAVQAMVELGWLGSEPSRWYTHAATPDGRNVMQKTNLTDLFGHLERLAREHPAYVLRLPRREDPDQQAFGEATDGVLSACFCGGVTMLFSERLLQVPYEWVPAARAVCPRCGKEAVADLTENGGNSYYAVAKCLGMALSPLPACGHCGEAVEPSAMRLALNESRQEDAEPRTEEGPFAHFMIDVHAPLETTPESCDKLSLDPELVARLGAVLECPLRTIGRWALL